MDLNLIRIFLSIYETRNLTKSAERLRVTQSAVSQSLAKLRKAIGDPLFERRGSLMRPTDVAADLYPTFRDAIVNIDLVLGHTEQFVPQESTRRFRIALSELGEVGWLPNIVTDIRREAPRIKVQTVSVDVGKVEDWLQQGTVDVAIAPAGLGGHLIRNDIKTQDYVVLMSTEHKVANVEMTLERYVEFPRVIVSSDSGAERLGSSEHAAEIETAAMVRIQHYSSMPSLIMHSPELIAVAPRTIALGWSKVWPIVIKELPFQMEPLRLSVYRRAEVTNNPGLEWLYRTVLKAAVGLPETFQGLHAEG